MSQHPRTALIIGDDEPTRDRLVAELDHLGYECVALPHGQEALYRVATQEFDLININLKLGGSSCDRE